MRTLFVAGPGRSGTTAFAEYLNQHEALLICRERYKFVPRRITPDYFDFDRILEHGEEETNLPRDYHVKLLSGKDPSRIRWIGDKTPNHVRHLEHLNDNNPGSRFIILYRPVEEVAKSYEARSRNPNDSWLGGKNGFEIGVRDFNVALAKMREFVESEVGAELLIVDYHDFFDRNEACIALLSNFLEVEFDETVREKWRRMSLEFQKRRRRKEPCTDEQLAYIRDNKDYAAEAWTLRRIKQQWESLGSEGDESASIAQDQLEKFYLSAGRTLLGGSYGPGGTPGQPWLSPLRVEELKSQLAEERKKNRLLKRHVQRAKRSRTWKITRTVRRIRSRVFKTKAGKLWGRWVQK